MFDPILVPLDGSLLSECVLPHAICVAQAFESKMTLLRMMDKSQASASMQLFDPLNWQIRRTQAQLYLDKMETRLKKLGVHVEAQVMEGLVADGIAEYAQNYGAKLVVLSSHGRNGVSQWGISSVALKIILNAPTSALIIRAHQPISNIVTTEQPYRQIMIPLDGSQRAEYALPLVMALAKFYNSRVHLVHVVKSPEMARRLPPTSEDVELSNRIVARNQEEAASYLEEVKSRFLLNEVDAQTHLVVSDNAIATLHHVVERENIDLVALSAHGYSGNNQWPYGSMVNNFILYGKVPLLIAQDLPARKEAALVDVSVRERAEH
jgi:nucleotide-binding universal stress UspA family protein